jgi:hypothetical protein
MKIHACAAIVLLMAVSPAALAQPADRIRINLDVRSEGRPDRDATATRLLADVQRGLEAIADVEIGSRDESRRVVWIVVGAAPGPPAASVIVTERYDRETLMVLGIEDDDMAHRMMALQIVIDHQIFTGGTPTQLAKRIVTALDTGVFARLRAVAKQKP